MNRITANRVILTLSLSILNLVSFSVVSEQNEPYHPLGSYPDYFTFLDVDDSSSDSRILQSKSVFFIHINDDDHEGDSEKSINRNTAFFIRTKRDDDKLCAVTSGHSFEDLTKKEFTFDGYFNYLGKDAHYTVDSTSLFFSSTSQVNFKGHIKGELVVDGGARNDATADIALFLVDKKDLPQLEMLAESGYQFDNVRHNFTYSIHHAKGWPQRISYFTYFMPYFEPFKKSSIANAKMMVSEASSGAPIGILNSQNQFGPYIGVLESGINVKEIPEEEKMISDRDVEIPYANGMIYTTLSSIEDAIERECLKLDQGQIPFIPFLAIPLLNTFNTCKANNRVLKDNGISSGVDNYCLENTFSLVNSTKYKIPLTIYGESQNDSAYIKDTQQLHPYSKLVFRYSDSMGGYAYDTHNETDEIRIVSIGLDGSPKNFTPNELVDVASNHDILYFQKGNNSMSLFYKPREGHLMHRPIIDFDSSNVQLNETADYINPELNTFIDALSINSGRFGDSFFVEVGLAESEQYFDPRKIENIIFQNQSYQGLNEYSRVRITGRDLYFNKENDIVKIEYEENSPYFYTINGSGSKGTLQQIDLCHNGDFSTASGNEFDFYWSGENAIVYRDRSFDLDNNISTFEVKVIDFFQGTYRNHLDVNGVCGSPEQLFIKISLSEDKKTFYITLEGDGENQALIEPIQ
ncbi:hypothetical protein [Vibrio navarrensis]|uniref:hypothetical protein n=1 Tax=Vibrio navarrensis TaxID=29495 RepID=UPI0013028667|nr:hypothetical protein [Vibrio navarrensis]